NLRLIRRCRRFWRTAPPSPAIRDEGSALGTSSRQASSRQRAQVSARAAITHGGRACEAARSPCARSGSYPAYPFLLERPEAVPSRRARRVLQSRGQGG